LGHDVENEGIKANRILEYINKRRKDASLRSYSPQALGRALAELGFTEKGNKVKKSDGIYYLFNSMTDGILQRGLS